LDALANLTAQVTAQAGARTLTIGVGPTFATRWLIPRLADFRRREPDIEVRVTAGGVAASFADDWTCGITLGSGDWPGLVSERLFAADLQPVCAPRLAARLKRPGDLKGPNLLRVAHGGDEWRLWLEAAGVSRVTARGPEFQYYGQALQAAADGIGVAMGIRPYIDDDIRAGRLVAPFPLTVPKGKEWYLVYRDFRKDQRDFAAFRRWLMEADRGKAARRKRQIPR
jgi:LysR family glycine cleavage system transcriptional activator